MDVETSSVRCQRYEKDDDEGQNKNEDSRPIRETHWYTDLIPEPLKVLMTYQTDQLRELLYLHNLNIQGDYFELFNRAVTYFSLRQLAHSLKLNARTVCRTTNSFLSQTLTTSKGIFVILDNHETISPAELWRVDTTSGDQEYFADLAQLPLHLHVHCTELRAIKVHNDNIYAYSSYALISELEVEVEHCQLLKLTVTGGGYVSKVVKDEVMNEQIPGQCNPWELFTDSVPIGEDRFAIIDCDRTLTGQLQFKVHVLDTRTCSVSTINLEVPNDSPILRRDRFFQDGPIVYPYLLPQEYPSDRLRCVTITVPSNPYVATQTEDERDAEDVHGGMNPTTFFHGEVDLLLRTATIDKHGERTWLDGGGLFEGDFILSHDSVVWVPKLLDNMQQGVLLQCKGVARNPIQLNHHYQRVMPGDRFFALGCLPALVQAQAFSKHEELAIFQPDFAELAPVVAALAPASPLLNALNNPLLSDCQLQLETRTFHAHSLLLGLHSPVFHAMLTSDYREASSRIICLPSEPHPMCPLDEETVLLLLKHIHGGLAQIPPKKLPNLLAVAHKYQVSSLLHICLKQVEQTQAIGKNNVATYYYLGQAFDIEGLKKRAAQFVRSPEVLHEVLLTEKYIDLLHNHPTIAHQLCLEATKLQSRASKRRRLERGQGSKDC